MAWLCLPRSLVKRCVKVCAWLCHAYVGLVCQACGQCALHYAMFDRWGRWMTSCHTRVEDREHERNGTMCEEWKNGW